ncbi:MAG: ACT domain-containing protein, partial [Actinomycetota bacterium]
METFVVRVWLPDRPGVLGQVASRIGSVHGDVVGIEILERGGGSAIDDLTVSLPDASLVDLLVNEIRQVEGAAVEHIRPVPSDRPDGGMAALATAPAVVAAPIGERLQVACRELRVLLDADWSVAMCLDGPVALALDGDAPELDWLAAFLAGSSHLGEDALTAEAHHTPGDLVWTRVPAHGLALA